MTTATQRPSRPGGGAEKGQAKAGNTAKARPQTQQRKASTQPPGKKGAPARKAPAKAPDNKGTLHGVEAVAALVVTAQGAARTKTKMMLVLLAVVIMSLGWNSIQSLTRPEPKLLAMTNDGRVQPLPLLDEPVDNRATIVDWARRNLPKLYDLNYVNYHAQLNKNLDFMAQKTNQSFVEMLEKSQILPKVIDEFLILRATVVAEPIVTNEVVVSGTRVWVVEAPMNLIYDSGEVKDNRRRQVEQPIVFKAWIARASPIQYDGGLVLAKFDVLPRKTDRRIY